MSTYPYGAASYYEQPGPGYPASKAMAGWALGLSLAFCLWPLTSLVSIGLGIAVLVQGRDGRDNGKGMAIAALVVDGLVLLAMLGLFAAGVVQAIREGTADRDESGQVTGPSEIFVDDLAVGDCVLEMQFADQLAKDETPTGMVTVVPCGQPHRAEVYHIFELDPDDFPDQRSLDTAAVKGCVAEYDDYVGKSYARSKLALHYYDPSKDQGVLASDTVTCLVATASWDTTTSMLAGSGK